MESPLSKGWSSGGGGGRAQRYRPASEFDEATLAKKREYWRTKKREQRAKERNGTARPGTGDLLPLPAPSPPLAPGPPGDEGLSAEWSCQMDPQGPAGDTASAAAGLCDVLVSPSFFDVLDLDELPDGEAPAPEPWGARLSASPVAAEPQLGGEIQEGAWAGGPPDGPPPSLDPPAPARARRPATPQHKERWFQRLKLNKILPQFPRACLGAPDEQEKPALRLKFTRVPQGLGADCWDLQAAGPGRDRAPPEPRPDGAVVACPQAQDNGAPPELAEPPHSTGLPRLRIPPDVADGVRVNAQGGRLPAAPETGDEKVARRREYWRLKKREQRAKVLARARESCRRPDAQPAAPPPPRAEPGPQAAGARRGPVPTGGQLSGPLGSRKGRRLSGKARAAAAGSGVRRPPASVSVKQEPAVSFARGEDAVRLGGPGAGLLAEAALGVRYAAPHFSRAPSPGARAALWRQKARDVAGERWGPSRPKALGVAGACRPAALGADPRGGGPLAAAAAQQQQLEEERMARRREYWRVKKREQRAKLSAEAKARMKERDAHLRRVKRYQTILGEMRRGRLQLGGGRRPPAGLAAGDGELIGGFIKEDGTVTASIAPPAAAPAVFEAQHDVFNGQVSRFRPTASPPGKTRAALRGSPDRPPRERLGVTGPRPMPAAASCRVQGAAAAAAAITNEERMARKREYWRIKKREQRAKRAAQARRAFLPWRLDPARPPGRCASWVAVGPVAAAARAGRTTPRAGFLPGASRPSKQARVRRERDRSAAAAVDEQTSPAGPAEPQIKQQPPDEEPGPAEEGAAIETSPALTPEGQRDGPSTAPRAPPVQVQGQVRDGAEPTPLPPPPPLPPSAGRPQRNRATARRAESCCGPGTPGGPAPGRARPDLAEELRRRKREYWRVKKQEQRARKAARDRELRRRGGAEPAGGWGPAESSPPGARGQTGEASPQWLDCSDGEAQILHSGSPETSPRIGPDSGTTFRAKDRSAAGRPPEAHPGPPSPRLLSEGGGSGVPDSEAEWRALFLMDYDPLNQLLVCMVCGELQHSQSAEGARCHIEEAHPDSLGLSIQDRSRILAAWDEQVSLRERFFTSQLLQHQARPDETEDPPAEIEVLVDSDEAPASKDRRTSKNKSKNTDPQGRPRGAEDKRRRR